MTTIGYRVWCDLCKQESKGVPADLRKVLEADVCYPCEKHILEEAVRKMQREAACQD